MEEKIKGEKFTKIFKKGEAYVSTFYQCNNKKKYVCNAHFES